MRTRRFPKIAGNPFSMTMLTAVSLAMAAFLVVLASACGDDDEPLEGCQTAEDCPGDQICTGGQCVEPSGQSCRTVDDCDPGENCVNRVCVAASDAGDADTGTTDTGTTDTGVVDTGVDRGPDVVPDVGPDLVTTPPEVLETDPEDLETGVATNANVTIRFDQPMREATFPPAISTEDFGGADLEREISYNGETYTATLSPASSAANFRAATPYTVTVDRQVKGENGLEMTQDVSFTFFTAGYADVDNYQDLAEAYAPIVHAEVRPPDAADENNRIDWFTRYDFDGDLDASNNYDYANTAEPDFPAHVYYNVLESETHYFIQYVFYYPLAVDSDDEGWDEAVDHDFAFSLVVVKKTADDTLGTFVFAEGFGANEVWAFGLSDYPNPCGGDGEPECRGVTTQGGFDAIFRTFPSSDLAPATDGGPGRRYPLYMSEAVHASCLTTANGADRPISYIENQCNHNIGAGGPFDAANADWSRVLTFGDGDEWTTDEAEDNELTYSMSSFLDIFWTLRGHDLVYGTNQREYRPPTDGAGETTIVPTFLLRDDPESSNPTTAYVRHPPFFAAIPFTHCGSGCSNRGTWFIDPIYELDATDSDDEVDGHVEFDHDFSRQYCFNPYLGIDNRGTAGCGD